MRDTDNLEKPAAECSQWEAEMKWCCVVPIGPWRDEQMHNDDFKVWLSINQCQEHLELHFITFSFKEGSLQAKVLQSGCRWPSNLWRVGEWVCPCRLLCPPPIEGCSSPRPPYYTWRLSRVTSALPVPWDLSYHHPSPDLAGALSLYPISFRKHLVAAFSS